MLHVVLSFYTFVKALKRASGVRKTWTAAAFSRATFPSDKKLIFSELCDRKQDASFECFLLTRSQSSWAARRWQYKQVADWSRSLWLAFFKNGRYIFSWRRAEILIFSSFHTDLLLISATFWPKQPGRGWKCEMGSEIADKCSLMFRSSHHVCLHFPSSALFDEKAKSSSSGCVNKFFQIFFLKFCRVYESFSWKSTNIRVKTCPLSRPVGGDKYIQLFNQ